MKEYRIYKHTAPDGNVYIGQTTTSFNKRFHNGHNYMHGNKDNHPFAIAIRKYGWDAFKHEEVMMCNTQSEADYAEKYLICWYMMQGKCYNILQGGHNAVLSGNKHWLYGKHRTKEEKEKIRKTKTGTKLTEEWKQKIGKSLSIPIVQLSLNGDFIKEWESCSQASKELNINAGNISLCVNGIYKKTHGFKFKTKKEYEAMFIQGCQGTQRGWVSAR